MLDLLAFLHDSDAATEVSAERALLARFGGGCHVPIGARARIAGDQLKLIAIVANPEGRGLCRGEIAGAAREAGQLGRSLAEDRLRQGANKFLASAE